MNEQAATPILRVVSQHVDETASLWRQRARLIDAPDIRLLLLHRHDQRIVAHLDGIAVAGESGSGLATSALETPGIGEVFTAGVRALEDKDTRCMDLLFSLAEANPDAETGLTSAFEWVSSRYLKGTVSELLRSSVPYRQCVGIAACAAHQVNPGVLNSLTGHADPKVRSSALRTAGRLGLQDLRGPCTAAIPSGESQVRLWGAWASVLLGDRGSAVQALVDTALTAVGSDRERALRLAIQTLPPSTAHATLQRVGSDPRQLRWLIQGSGVNGDPKYVSWLIRQMADEMVGRLAGEAFTLITGADLDALELWRARPENFESGPTDNPDDENVDMDPDEGLMWPDPEKVARWWENNAHRFQPGQRYFMGAPVTREHCIHILKEGYQRQRILAAHYLCLLQPGTPLFNTSAPAWRQQRLLAQMA
jgi:uncharacterized protein (TIGR02270 family)